MTAGSRAKRMACIAAGFASAEIRVGAVESREQAYTALAAALAGKSLLNEAEALLQLGRIFTSSVHPQATFEAAMRAEQIFVAHGAPMHAAKCRVAAARALLDLGQERDAVERCKRALSELSLPVEHRVATVIVMAKSHAHFGNLEAASHLLRQSALPLTDVGSADTRIHVMKALAMVQIQMLLEVEYPHLHRSVSPVTGEGTDRSGGRKVLELLETIQAELPAGERCAQIEVMRQLTLGLGEPDGRAIEALSAVAAENLAVDPPMAAWACYTRALVHRNRRDLESAQQSVGRCLAIAEQWGLKGIARHALLQQSLIRESIQDYLGSLQAYKMFSAMQLRSVTANGEAPEPDVAAKSLPEDARGPTAAALLKPLESRHVKRAIRFIESNLSVPISVSDIAAECQVSRRTLEVAFKQSKACTLANYVKRRRLETAANLLKFSALLVSEVASAVGYRWPSAFARDFVTHYGVRPTDWRARQADDTRVEKEAVDGR